MYVRLDESLSAPPSALKAACTFCTCVKTERQASTPCYKRVYVLWCVCVRVFVKTWTLLYYQYYLKYQLITTSDFFLAHLKLFPKRQLVDGVGHVRVVWLRGGTVCGNMEVSWYLRTDR